MPISANAGFFSDLFSTTQASEETTVDHNSQNIPLLETAVNPDVKNIAQSDIYFVDEEALGTDNGLIGQGLESDSNGEIIVYEVKAGDTLSEIAETFDVSMNTIIWENNLSSKTVKIGQKLNILPVTGVKHIVKKGDSIDRIASKYDAEIEDILVFNGLSRQEMLKEGDMLIVPNGTISDPVEKPSTGTTPKKDPSSGSSSGSKVIPNGYYIKPSAGIITSPYGPRRSGYHYGVDIGNRRGTPVMAAAKGKVVKVVSHCVEGVSSCGGRYGNYIEIEHPNGQTTVYAHLQKIYVSVGQSVSQGKTIGTIGNTGRSTGPHLHFQVENANGSTIRPKF